MDEKKDGIELLRVYAEGKKEKRFCSILHGHYGDVDGDCMRGTCAECEGGYLAALADRIGREREELDKRLMPEGMEWPPKDCEGEDLHIGEKAHFLRTGYDGDHEWDDVIVAFRHQGVEGEGDAWIVMGEEGEAFACDCAVERPAVLAADGLPIEAGQTVYNGTGMELTIARIVPRESCVSLDHVKCTKKDSTAVYDLLPSELTHTPPDTQGRIDEDATMPPRAYYAKHIGHDVGLKDDAECIEAMVRHLLNRQRELDKRMMGGRR